MSARWLVNLGWAVGLVVVLLSGLMFWFTRDVSGPFPREHSELQVSSFIGKPHVAAPILEEPRAEHPFLAPAGSNSMHNDSYQSDAYAWAGPLGNSPQVDSALFHPLVGNCVAAMRNPQGLLISTCVTPFGVTLVARDPETLAILARKKITHWLPIGEKFGGGVYFHLDHEGHVLLASNEPAIEIWGLQGDGETLAWGRREHIAIGPALDSTREEEHRVIDVMPDWNGNYWFITRGGLVGVSDRTGANINVTALEGEGIDNALAVSANGVFVASNHAMYRFNLSVDGSPSVTWRETYDRGSTPKPGTMGHGTGTTPTLTGEGYVSIIDNADGRVHVVVYRQQPEQDETPFHCKVPVFKADRGTSENSMVAFGLSLIVENNFGYEGPFENISAEPGMAKIDIDPSGERCQLAWENLEISAPSSVPKLSLASGLVYVYTRDESNPDDVHAWYFTAVDAMTGEVVYKVLTGVGPKFNNHYGSISITPDGAAYIGTMGGVVRVRDGGNE